MTDCTYEYNGCTVEYVRDVEPDNVKTEVYINGLWVPELGPYPAWQDIKAWIDAHKKSPGEVW